ncbi:hypothetical protein [Limnoglobus roseus]|uniref:Uncharacterized protein n=1 Tax=Limnoglobus roseus TaxID=2598579 RepID=A0A5C1ATT7_9BACT|nr:hypothetical protein [Limnoglobus roseus]QEL20634.1 hypothetical protein PX52LOC_07740 [Limnoglobus roseus]
MGHQEPPPLSLSKPWREIVHLIHLGAGPEQVANAVLRALRAGLGFAGRDPAVVESVWLLLRIPGAARADDFGDALRDLGLGVGDAPDLFDLAAAVTAQVDARTPGNRGRTDLGEMAQCAIAEALTAYVGGRMDNLFGPSAEDTRHHLARAATPKHVGELARDFYARFFERALGYVLDRTLPDHVGPNRRFASLADQAAFRAALHVHCHEIARVVERYSAEWFSKSRVALDGPIDRAAASDYASYGFKKMLDALSRQAEAAAHA